MSPRTHIASVVLAASVLFATNGCVNNDPADPIAPGMSVSATTTMMTTTTPTMSTPDTTMCGGPFEGTGDVMVSPNCTNAAAVNCNIISFDNTSYMLDAADLDWSSDKWDEDGKSLSGGAFSYQTEGAMPLARALAENALHVTGNIAAGGFAGFGFWFGPCHDASPFEGLQFTLSGNVGTGSVTAQLQTDDNYPIDGTTKGNCAFTDDATKWDVCKNNKYALPGVDAANGYTYYIPWAQFVGGMPVATLSPNQLLGVQFEVGCGADGEDCVVDVQLHDLRFYRGHAEDLGPVVVMPEASTAAAADPAPTTSTPAAATTGPAPVASTPAAASTP